MDITELFEKAKSLPLEPGAYIMYNAKHTVIYVGKAKKLRNRVSQYFTALHKHNLKTLRMVTNVDHFEVILARSEFEALVLENSLIKQHKPKYNILLKDDKGYPYIKIDKRREYPEITLAPKLLDDGADYYGPFGSRYMTQNLLEALKHTLRLPTCGKQFPRDVGKERPCLNYHMNHCDGWCRLCKTSAQYNEKITQAAMILQGKYKSVAENLRRQMEEAAENLQFEQAAEYRDFYKSVLTLGEQQLITTGRFADVDVVGYSTVDDRSCFTILHYVGGTLLDKEFEISDAFDEDELLSLVEQYYIASERYPKLVLTPVPFENADLLQQYISEKYGKTVRFRKPERGKYTGLIEIAEKNAHEELERLRSAADRAKSTQRLLESMIGTGPINRIESYDISNIAGTDIVASMVVFKDGKLSKSDYKRFKVEGLKDQDDYQSMHQVLTRRFRHFLAGDKGFAEKPDVLFIDGGEIHAKIAEEAVKALGVEVVIWGMVKDSRHRTRALINAEGKTIEISSNQAVFSLVGRIQEEVHRFAITYHRELRSKRLSKSSLDSIPGIGEKRKELLLKHFKSLKAIRAASISELTEVIPLNAAKKVFEYLHGEEKETCGSSAENAEA